MLAESHSTHTHAHTRLAQMEIDPDTGPNNISFCLIVGHRQRDFSSRAHTTVPRSRARAKWFGWAARVRGPQSSGTPLTLVRPARPEWMFYNARQITVRFGINVLQEL